MELEVVIIEPTKQHTHTVVFLHGRGDKAKTFSTTMTWSKDSQGRSLIENFPCFRWVFPQATMRRAASDGGSLWSQWFDVWNVQNFSDREELQLEGLKESVPAIRRILEKEAQRLDGQYEKIVLAGISQGAATSVHMLLNLNLNAEGGGQEIQNQRRLAAFLGFSCRMPFAGRTLAETRALLGLDNVPEDDQVIRNTPMLLEHCVDDPLVLIQHGRALRGTLEGFRAQVTMKEYPTGGHWFNSPAGTDDAIDFIQRNVLNTTSLQSEDVTMADV